MCVLMERDVTKETTCASVCSAPAVCIIIIIVTSNTWCSTIDITMPCTSPRQCANSSSCATCTYLDALVGSCQGTTNCGISNTYNTSAGVVVWCRIGGCGACPLITQLLLGKGHELSIWHDGCGAMAHSDGCKAGGEPIKSRASVGAWTRR